MAPSLVLLGPILAPRQQQPPTNGSATPNNASPTLPLPAIIGIAAGGGVIVLICFLLFLRRMWRRDKAVDAAPPRSKESSPTFEEQANMRTGASVKLFTRANLTPSVVFPTPVSNAPPRQLPPFRQPGTKPLSRQPSQLPSSANFSRPNVLQQRPMTREEVIAHHTSMGDLPLPFAPFAGKGPTPFKFGGPSSSVSASGTDKESSSSSMASGSGPGPGATLYQHRQHATSGSSGRPGSSGRGGGGGSGTYNNSFSRRQGSGSVHSRFSSLSNSIRNSVLGLGRDSPGPSGTGGNHTPARGSGHVRIPSNASSVIPKNSQLRKVRATFEPLLPDEISLVLGEKVTIVQTFDDGWCVIGRTNLHGDIEMGAVPLWCFERPVKGWKDERMMRSTSLGVTIDMSGDEWDGERGSVISWSNF